MTNCSKHTLICAEDVRVLQNYCTGKKLVVELGTYQGGSARIISECCEKLITVDTFPDNRPEETFRITFEAVKESLSDCPNVEVRKNDGVDEADNFSNESVNVIFIDDGHKCETVLMEFFRWYRKIITGGMFIFHDYIPGIKYSNEGIRTAVHQILLHTWMVRKLEVRGQCLIAQKI